MMANTFKDKMLYEDWILNIVKLNDSLITTSLYHKTQFIESKAFKPLENDSLERLRQYIAYFQDSPKNNRNAMSNING